jgi:hypothetical protein
MKLLGFTILTSSLLLTSIQADITTKRILKSNMNIDYTVLPQDVNYADQILKNSVIYGRLRANSFIYDYDTKLEDHDITGIGGSVIIKTAPFHGFSGTVGFYTSQVPFNRMEESEVAIAKAGKDLFSRDNVRDGKSWGISIIGQAYLEAKRGKTVAKVGRQLVHTVFTKSNDTKMIPNTFDGVTLVNKSLPKTKIQLAYLTGQKLRDHINTHDILAFNSWSENDDGAVNKSLTSDLIGTDNKLQIVSASTKAFKNHKFDVSIANIPNVLTTTIVEGNHIFKFRNGLKITPAVRYINQQDNLNTIVSVANLKADTKGYKNPNSLDSDAFMAKVDIKKGAMKFRVGYSKIADKADLVAPWRGFPTGGYTRAMAQYNWNANTKTYMIRADYDFGKAKIAKNLTGLIRYAIQDFDDLKSGVQADSSVIHIDIAKKISSNLYTKLRVGLVDMDKNILDIDGRLKYNNSYNEYRFEVNYLF